MSRNFLRPLLRPLILCVPICVPLCAAAQSTPTPPQASPAQPQTTLHANVNLVVVDVTVDDARSNPVHHLTAGDFTVLEDGKPQTLTVFEEHAAGPAAPLRPAPSFGPGTFTNYSPAPANAALNILLFDLLNTPPDEQAVVRGQVLKYLKEAPPGTRTAIFALTTQLRLLQGFTTNPELLRALVEGMKAYQGVQPDADDATLDALLPGGLGLTVNGAAKDGATGLAGGTGGNSREQDIRALFRQGLAEQESYRLQDRAGDTLDALNQLAHYMSNLPGRKNLIWFSGSFPIAILADPSQKNPFIVMGSAEDEYRETVDLLSRSQVSVYPIDAHGLTGINSTGFFDQTDAEKAAMQRMAEDTGGMAFENSNDLKEAVEKAIDAGANYYTVAYAPANRNWNGAYRGIQVKVDRPGVSLSYRRGYYADDPSAPPHSNPAQEASSDPSRHTAIRAAMLHGAPDPTEFIFEASVRPSSANAEPDIAPGNQAAKKVSGPWRRYTVTFLTNPKQVNWTRQPDGAERFGVDFLTAVYDAGGNLVNLQSNVIGGDVPAGKFAAAMQHNLEYRQQISVPVKGEYYLRVGMRDASTDRVGALELPVTAVAKLPPAAAGPAPASTPK